MWYAIISEDIDNSLPRRLAARPAHLDRLHELKDQGRLLLAGLIRRSIIRTRVKQVLLAAW